MNKNIKITLGSIYLIILITFLYFLLSKFDTSRISDFSYYKEIQINLEEIIGKNLIVNLILFSVIFSYLGSAIRIWLTFAYSIWNFIW